MLERVTVRGKSSKSARMNLLDEGIDQCRSIGRPNLTVVIAASAAAIPSWLAPYPRVQERAGFLDANAAEATPRP
jgi:hypothetical protein